MNKIFSIHKGLMIGNFAIRDIDYTKDTPYYIVDMKDEKTKAWKTLSELREINHFIEDYNMPYSFYNHHFNCKYNGDFDFEKAKDLLKNPTNYLTIEDGEEILRNAIGLVLEGVDIELEAERTKFTELTYPSKVSFDFFICKKWGNNKNDWDSFNFSPYEVNIPNIIDLLNKDDKELLSEELYNILIKSCQQLGLYFSKINNALAE